MKKGYLYIAIVTLLFSSMEIALKTIAGEFNPVQLNIIRFFIGSMILLPMTIRTIRRRKIVLTLSDFVFFALTGFVGITVSMTFYQLSLMTTKASIVAAIFSCNPVFIVPFAFILLKERIYPHTIITMVLCLTGIGIIMSPFVAQGSGSVIGIVFDILAAITFALYGVIGKFRAIRFGGLATTCFSFILATAEMLVIIFLGRIAPVADILNSIGLGIFAHVPLLGGINSSNILTLLYAGIFVSGLGYAFYFMAIETTSATVAAIVFYIKPALAPVLAWLLIGESVSMVTIAGIAFIVVGSAATFIGNTRLSGKA